MEQIKLFRSLFNGREDAFAIRWEKGNKSGYMPSYQFDPYHYRIHKAKGGTLANYQDKTLQPLTDEQVKRHLLGDSTSLMRQRSLMLFHISSVNLTNSHLDGLVFCNCLQFVF